MTKPSTRRHGNGSPYTLRAAMRRAARSSCFTLS